MTHQFATTTRGGFPVVVYDTAVPCSQGFSIHGRVFYEKEDRWLPQAWMSKGQVFGAFTPHALDLVVAEKEDIFS